MQRGSGCEEEWKERCSGARGVEPAQETSSDDSSGIITDEDDGQGLARVHESVAHPGDLSDLRACVFLQIKTKSVTCTNT